MAVMRFALRSPLAGLVPWLLLVPVSASTGGCSSDGEADGNGPTVTATGPTSARTEAPTDDATPPPTDEPTDESSITPPEAPDAVAAACTPYAAMVDAIDDVETGSADYDAIAAEIGPVMKEFARQLPDLERPPGMSAATWRGVLALAERILALPDQPTNAEIEAVEDELTEQEREAVQVAADWFKRNCSV